MGFPTRACREPTSEDAMKQSLRLVRDVSLSMSWRMESLPGGGGGGGTETTVSIRLPLRIHSSAGKLEFLTVALRHCCRVSSQPGAAGCWFSSELTFFAALAGTIAPCWGACKQGASC